ncbi:homoserine O-acetyltransferase [Psychrobacter arcticus 273-4]|uniref:Homoserine O-succinyltransferase n=1 Tax=Psychrobacter arcticus (strain DSM 17307 / VKM B-2377 / 273-4) TaxID=259536 RepID=METXS_PSYA2|nr:homoserine O-acetyltransferase [Psychrobacter arcticus]Q4FUR4.1 RecName: Full=Homoserine O-succinyltransferase; Short=HST; AltName: Full=Homoserine transsuccinylase; Short=HTS [Psychrobacter arcticus 273-4]AAZ18244.1 homoserine O-acetyltransferase [Psychrobacter arcticus 273-4]
MNSVGVVKPQTLHFAEPLTLECNRTLPSFELIIETYGTLNSDKSNAVLICHALSGSHHAAGFHSDNDKKAGWWDNMIGPNKSIDTNRFFVVCVNNIGSCFGSTGPTSINPESSKAQVYGPDFPLVTIKDWVKTQAMLSDRLEIDVWHAVVGGSMGGMQALQWAADYPSRLKRCVVIASTPKLSAQNIAFNEVARQSILSDPDFKNGRYLQAGTYPRRGLILARMVGHITYLTDDAMKAKFGRDLKSGKFMYGYDVEFQVESYLRYQGERFSENFDANTYLLMTKALDYFDPTRDYPLTQSAQPIDSLVPEELLASSLVESVKADSSEDELAKTLADSADIDNISASNHQELTALKAAFAHTECQYLIVSFTTDWRFAPERSQEIVDALMATGKPVSYINVDAPHGHDSFLFDIPRYMGAVKGFLNAPFMTDNQSKNSQQKLGARS